MGAHGVEQVGLTIRRSKLRKDHYVKLADSIEEFGTFLAWARPVVGWQQTRLEVSRHDKRYKYPLDMHAVSATNARKQLDQYSYPGHTSVIGRIGAPRQGLWRLLLPYSGRNRNAPACFPGCANGLVCFLGRNALMWQNVLHGCWKTDSLGQGLEAAA